MLIVVWKNVKEVGSPCAYVLNSYLIRTQRAHEVLISSSKKVNKIAEVTISVTDLVSSYLLSVPSVHLEPSKVHFSKTYTFMPGEAFTSEKDT